MKRRVYLLVSFNVIEVFGEGVSEKLYLREVEFIGYLDIGILNIYGCLCFIVSIILYVFNCMLLIVFRNIVLV